MAHVGIDIADCNSIIRHIKQRMPFSRSATVYSSEQLRKWNKSSRNKKEPRRDMSMVSLVNYLGKKQREKKSRLKLSIIAPTYRQTDCVL